ncbi:MAG: hypothetical protein L0Z62_36750, partial [Gemmataceae bacterium]|nr:hypothetical protein [Gemmataceae bacterium]
EKRTLRCLFDLSCIDPRQRDPEKLWRVGAAGREVDLEQFLHFCRDNPRLVRRLREQLNYEYPRDIVSFLADNREVPSRFKPIDDPDNNRLKPVTEQFPCLPITRSAVGRGWPDPTRDNFGRAGGDQDVDVFEVTRAWYEFAQDPLPPENGQWGLENEPNAIPGRHRLPRMSQYIFRTYPARARAYVAEEMQKEGWFDGEGWVITRWFDELPRGGEQEIVVGKADRFNARLAWERSWNKYLEYGKNNGLPPPRELMKLADLAQRRGAQSQEARQLIWVDQTVRMTAYHDFVYQTEAEKDRATVEARRKLYEAERQRNKDEDLAMATYQRAIDEWIDVLLKFPGFARLPHVQDDLYEPQLYYLRLVRENYKRQPEGRRLEPRLLAVSAVGPPPLLMAVPAQAIHPATLVTHLLDEDIRQGYLERAVTQAALRLRPGVLPIEAAALGALTPWSGRPDRAAARVKRNILMRNIAGPLDWAFLYSGPSPLDVVQERWSMDEPAREAFMGQVVALNQAALSLRPGVFPLEILVMDGLIPPGARKPAPWPPEKAEQARQRERYRNRLLLLMALRENPPGSTWRSLITDSTIQGVRDRLGITPPPPQAPPPEAGPTPPKR